MVGETRVYRALCPTRKDLVSLVVYILFSKLHVKQYITYGLINHSYTCIIAITIFTAHVLYVNSFIYYINLVCKSCFVH